MSAVIYNEKLSAQFLILYEKVTDFCKEHVNLQFFNINFNCAKNKYEVNNAYYY